MQTNPSKAVVQLEAALLAASKYSLITIAERDHIRAAFERLSEAEKEAFLDGHLERPLAVLSPEKRERLVTLMHNILSRLAKTVD